MFYEFCATIRLINSNSRLSNLMDAGQKLTMISVDNTTYKNSNTNKN